MVTLAKPAIGSTGWGGPVNQNWTDIENEINNARPVATGGTGTTVQFTPGSIVFAGAAGVYTQDNANLFWDNTNKRLGIKTNAPTAFLDIRNNSKADLLNVLNASVGVEGHFLFRVSGNDQTDPYNLGMALGDFEKFTVSCEDGGNRQAMVFGDGTVAAGATIWGVATSIDAGVTWIPRLVVKQNGSVGIGTKDQFGSGAGVVGIADALTVPTTDPTGGHVLYSEAGALKGRGSSGTITTIAPAEPHCPRCNHDFVLEWENHKTGKLSVCIWCLSEALEKIGHQVTIEKRSGPAVKSVSKKTAPRKK